METKRKGGQEIVEVQVVITPTPEEQQENQIVIRRNLDDLHLLTEAVQVTSMLNRTRLSESEIRVQYSSFMSVCPDGLMTKTKFLELTQVKSTKTSWSSCDDKLVLTCSDLTTVS